jgi:hypothetical protein
MSSIDIMHIRAKCFIIPKYTRDGLVSGDRVEVLTEPDIYNRVNVYNHNNGRTYTNQNLADFDVV